MRKTWKMSLFNQVLREIAMWVQSHLNFLTLKVALNLVSHYFVFLVHLLGMFSHINMALGHIQYMQSSSLIFRKCSNFKLLPTTLEQKRKLWLWSIWFQIVNSVSCLSPKRNVTLLSYDYNTGFGTKILDTSSVTHV